VLLTVRHVHIARLSIAQWTGHVAVARWSVERGVQGLPITSFASSTIGFSLRGCVIDFLEQHRNLVTPSENSRHLRAQ
jgi:hypothetical protein